MKKTLRDRIKELIENLETESLSLRQKEEQFSMDKNWSEAIKCNIRLIAISEIQLELIKSLKESL